MIFRKSALSSAIGHKAVYRLHETLLDAPLLAREAHPLVINSIYKTCLLAIKAFRDGKLHVRSAIFVRVRQTNCEIMNISLTYIIFSYFCLVRA